MAMAPLRGSSLLSSFSGGEGTCCLGAKGLAMPPKASANVAAPTLVLVLAAEEDTDDLGANAAVDERRVAATLRAATDLELTSMIVIGKLQKDAYRLWRIALRMNYSSLTSSVEKSEDVVRMAKKRRSMKQFRKFVRGQTIT